jgi:ubiquinone/menaquinone biosynthesis C-methylase UbiE
MSLWSDRAFLRDVQYQTDVNLTARQSIYSYQQPPVDMVGQGLDLVLPAGGEGADVVADIGCGNGRYLAELVRREKAGHLVGVDLSPGMLRAARQRAQQAGRPGRRGPDLVAADVAALPLRDSCADLTLAMGMLYHVPEPESALRELRRVTRPGGRLLVGLNGVDHHRELRAVIRAGLADLGHQAGPMVGEPFGLDEGEALLRGLFASVARHEFRGQLVLPDAEPVAAYVRSMSLATRVRDPEALVRAVTSRLPNGPGATFLDTTHTGCLVCA